MRRLSHPFTLASVVALTAGLRLVAGCAAPLARGFDGAGGDGGAPATSTSTGEGGGLGVGGAPVCGSAPADARGAGVSDAEAAIFASAAGVDAPFVFDPPSGVVLPAGWPSPSFLVHTSELPAIARLTITLGATEIAFTASPEEAQPAHDGASITGAWWTIALPSKIWDAARCGGAGHLSWSVAYALPGSAAPDGAASGTIELLATATQPDMSYWEIGQPSGGKEAAFSIRRLAVESGVPQTLVTGQNGCIGCHTSSPDGQDIAYQTTGTIGWKVEIVRPVANADAVPSPAVTEAARSLLDSAGLMVPATSPGAWGAATGRWIAAISGSKDADAGRVALLQVDAASPAIALSPDAHPGDASVKAATPALSPDAKRIVYVATDGMVDGYFGPAGWAGPTMSADLWQVPVTITKDQAPVFGAPSPVPFASGTKENETFPTFSRDGKLLAFMRSKPGRGGYDEETGEIWVMPADASAPPVRIAANDAPADASVFSGQGLTSSWPRFGETTVTTPEGTYYMLLFSSRRGSPELWEDEGGGSSPVNGRPIVHLYLTMVRLANDGTLTTFPAALVPGQRVDAGAHTATFTTVTSVPPPPPPK